MKTSGTQGRRAVPFLLRIVALGLLILAAPNGSLGVDISGADNPLPKIFRDWEKRRQEISLITYRFAGTQTWQRGAYNKTLREMLEEQPSVGVLIDKDPPFSKYSADQLPPGPIGPPDENPPSNVTGMVSCTVTLDFKNNRCRIEAEDDFYNNLDRSLEHYRSVTTGNEGISSTRLLDGIWSGDASKPPPNFLIYKGDPALIPAWSFENNYYIPLFFASGVVPTKGQRVKTVTINPTIDASAFKFEGYRTEQGRQLALLRVDYDAGYSSISHYWVDLERDSAVVKSTFEFDSGYGSICSIEYSLTAGNWLPNHWKTTTFGDQGRTNCVGSFSVSEVTPLSSIASESFVQNPSPGMYVWETGLSRDPRTREMVVEKNWYRLKADGSKSGQQSNTNRFGIR